MTEDEFAKLVDVLVEDFMFYCQHNTEPKTTTFGLTDYGKIFADRYIRVDNFQTDIN